MIAEDNLGECLRPGYEILVTPGTKIRGLVHRHRGDNLVVFDMSPQWTVADFAGNRGVFARRVGLGLLVVALGAGADSAVGRHQRLILVNDVSPVVTVLTERFGDCKMPHEHEDDGSDHQQTHRSDDMLGMFHS